MQHPLQRRCLISQTRDTSDKPLLVIVPDLKKNGLHLAECALQLQSFYCKLLDQLQYHFWEILTAATTQSSLGIARQEQRFLPALQLTSPCLYESGWARVEHLNFLVEKKHKKENKTHRNEKKKRRQQKQEKEYQKEVRKVKGIEESKRKSRKQ